MSFGSDTSCTNELKPGRLVSGNRLVAEAAYRRLTTPRGSLRGGEDEQNYGLDLSELIGEDARILPALPQMIKNELTKDERIEDVNAIVTVNNTVPVEVTIDIEAFTADGPFSLQIGVDAVTVELLKVAA